MLLRYFGFIAGMIVALSLLTVVMVQNEEPARGDHFEKISKAVEDWSQAALHEKARTVDVEERSGMVIFRLILPSQESTALLQQARDEWSQTHPGARMAKPDEWDPQGYPPPNYPLYLRIFPE